MVLGLFWVVCKIPLLARALGLKAYAAARHSAYAAARPSARATIGYLVYNILGQKLAILVTFFKISTSISGFFKVSVTQSLVTSAKINIDRWLFLQLLED